MKALEEKALGDGSEAAKQLQLCQHRAVTAGEVWQKGRLLQDLTTDHAKHMSPPAGSRKHLPKPAGRNRRIANARDVRPVMPSPVPCFDSRFAPNYVGRNAPAQQALVRYHFVTSWTATTRAELRLSPFRAPDRTGGNLIRRRRRPPPRQAPRQRGGVECGNLPPLATPPDARALVRARLDLVPTTTRHRRPTSESEAPIFKVVA